MTKPRQLVLPLPQSVSLARDDYYVSDSNRAAVAAVESWPQWTGGMLAVIGPPGSGKSHLASVHADRAQADGRLVAIWPDAGRADLIVEDADRLAGSPAQDEALFHAFNRAASGGSILFTARTPIAGWPVLLPDLRTRLNTVVTAELPAPDDGLLQAVLLKLFADRQIDPERAAETASWLLPRMDRSLAAARALVAELDARSLAEKRRIDAKLAAEVLNPALDL